MENERDVIVARIDKQRLQYNNNLKLYLRLIGDVRLDVAAVHVGQHDVRPVVLEDEPDHREHVTMTEALHPHHLLEEGAHVRLVTPIACRTQTDCLIYKTDFCIYKTEFLIYKTEFLIYKSEFLI